MLGEILRELRKDRGMTQADLAEKLSLSPLTISAYECGRSSPDDDVKIKIAQIFNVSLDYLPGLIREPLPYERSRTTVVCPADFTDEEIESVRKYVAFLRFSKDTK
ncbi:helix-turn-helix domain-containing protein [Gemmiger sp.]